MRRNAACMQCGKERFKEMRPRAMRARLVLMLLMLLILHIFRNMSDRQELITKCLRTVVGYVFLHGGMCQR